MWFQRIIFEELCKGETREESRKLYEDIAARYIENEGADGVILGCTEVGMLLNQGNVGAPVFDTALIHCDTVLKISLPTQ